MRRVLPVIRQLAPRLKVPISIDTMKPAVAKAALDAGASLSGTSNAGQFLTISADNSNTVATSAAGFTNGGTVTLDCPMGGCVGSAPLIDVRNSTLTNSGTITVKAAASGGGGFAGNVTNTGTLQLNGNATFTNSTGTGTPTWCGYSGFAAPSRRSRGR